MMLILILIKVTRVTWSRALMVTADQRSTTSLFTWWTLTITTLKERKKKMNTSSK